MSPYEQTKARWFTVIDAGGYRRTKPLQVIVDILVKTHRALSPMEIFEQGRGVFSGLGLVTVYRTLDKLVELNLVHRVHQSTNCQGYLPAVEGHQHLLLCTGCGQVEYFSGDDLDDLVATISSRTGYKIDGHWLQLMGRCEDCAA